MKKLLLTSALIGSTLVASNAFAQTTVSGNLDITFRAIEEKGSTPAGKSMNGFGKEAQINIQNKGKLNNGWDYAAGFAIEDDGNQAGTYFNENTYIDFISGTTTVTIGQDHIQNNDRTLANFAGLIAEDLTNSAAAGRNTDRFLAAVGANPADAYGIGIVQTVGKFGNLSANFVPNNRAATISEDLAGEDSVADVGKSAWEVGFVGTLGVAGLNTHAFYNEEKRTSGNAKAIGSDIVGYNIGASYNVGQLTVGANYKYSDNGKTGVATTTTAADGTIKQQEFGIAYAVTPNVTLAANYTKAESNVKAESDAKSKSVAIGYNLGAVAVTAQAAQLENYTGVANVDADVLFLRASTKF
jgi:predicted porin